MKGLITKGVGGFYYVETEQGTYRAKGRGHFKKDGIILSVGDYVELEVRDDGDSVIDSIYPRKNSFIRPPIANVDKLIIVSAAKKPAPNFQLIDKFLIMAESHDVECIVCFNKVDLVKEDFKDYISSIYGGEYPLVFVSTLTGEGIQQLESMIAGKTVAFAGPSGVGKSTIINKIVPEAHMETGKISEKTSRGRHTTRHVQIFDYGKGKIFDTPGFTSFDILDVDEEQLGLYYPEISRYAEGCRFDNCRHLKEPDCAVRKAVEEGKISKLRYESYVQNLEDIRNRNRY